MGAVDRYCSQTCSSMRLTSARTSRALRARATPREPRARRELRQRRAATPRLHRVDDRDIYLMTRGLQRGDEQIDVAREADAVRLADDVDAHCAPRGRNIPQIADFRSSVR